MRRAGPLQMVDESGGDEKIIAVPAPHITKRYDNVHDYTHLPEIMVQQIEHFFQHYKDLEYGKWAKTGGWVDHEGAERLIVEAIERAKA